MRLPLLDPDNDASVDIEQLKEMVDLFISSILVLQYRTPSYPHKKPDTCADRT